MHFAFVIYRYFPHGGLQKDLLRAAEAATRRGHRVSVLVAQLDAPLPESVAETIRFKVSGVGNHARMKDFEGKVGAFLTEHSFDRVVMFNRMAGGDFYFAADNCLATKWKRRFPGWFLRIAPRYRTFLELEKNVFSPAAATKIFAIVPPQIRDYRTAYATPEERFILLPVGIDPEFAFRLDADAVRRRVREEFSVPEDGILLIQVAAQFHTKGVDRTLRALLSLPQKWRGRIRLLVAGGGVSPRWRKFAASLGVDAQTIFAGARSDVPDLLAAADLMVHPAREESAGNVIAEARSAGLPVVASGACGFAGLAAELDGKLVTEEPFRQRELDETLVYALENLAALQEKAKLHARDRDFFRRAEAFIDALEKAR